MTVGEIIDVIEQFAPLAAQDSFDNSGLTIGRRETQISSALLCVDVTDCVLDEALRLGSTMVISHHPLIFNPLYNLTGANLPQRLSEKALKNDIALYAAHTNLDAAPGGMSYRLAEILGVQNPVLLGKERPDMAGVGYGVLGKLQQPMESIEFLRMVKKKLNIGAIRHSVICNKAVQKVALHTGSGGSYIETAVKAGADIYMAADFKYNNFIDADDRLIVADIGHFESEYCAIELLYDIITKKIPTFVLYKSEESRNPVNYLV